MTQESLKKSVRDLVTQITRPLPDNHFKERYIEIFYEELLRSAQKHYTKEQQQRFVEVATFLQEVGPEKYSEYQAEIQGNILRRLVEEGFNQ